MIYEKVITSVSNYLARELNLPAVEKDRIRYGLEVFISGSWTFIFSILIAYLLDLTYPVFLILITGGILKSFSGGVHFKSMQECTLLTAIFVNLLGSLNTYLSNYFSQLWPLYLLTAAIFILTVLIKFSPAEVPEKPLTAVGQRQKLKFLSILISSILIISITILFYLYQQEFLLFNISVISGLFFQALLITPAAYRVIAFYYRFKTKLFR